MKQKIRNIYFVFVFLSAACISVHIATVHHVKPSFINLCSCFYCLNLCLRRVLSAASSGAQISSVLWHHSRVTLRLFRSSLK